MPHPAHALLLAKRPSGAAFDPRTQVTALHVVWADDPDWADPGDGQPVDSWRNQSGGGDPANTLLLRPTFRASTAAFNNRATVQFDSTAAQYLIFDITDQAQPFKMLIVAQAATAGNQGLIGRGGNFTHGLRFVPANWSLNYGSGVNGGTNDGNPHVIRATVNGASSQLWLDGSSVASGNAGTGGQSHFMLGAVNSMTPTFFLSGHIAFAALYSGATSDTDLATLENDLQTYYGTP